MKRKIFSLPRLFLAFVSMIFGGPIMAVPGSYWQDTQQPMLDNNKKNKDRSEASGNQQKVNPSDRVITQKDRKAIQENHRPSTYRHNFKVIAPDGE